MYSSFFPSGRMEFDQAHGTCAACEFWTGERQSNPLRQTSVVNSPAACGGCTLPGEEPSKRPAIGKCGQWQVWNVLTVRWTWGAAAPTK